MYRIDDDLKELVESGIATIVGTADDEGRPELAYGWAPRVSASGTAMEVFLDTERAHATLKNLRSNGRIAVTIADPMSLRSVQFKGHARAIEDAPDEADRAWVQQQREAFLITTSLVGDPPSAIRNMWLDEVLRVTFEVERAFDQTPGPRAGTPL
jgi:general stress protein 26